MKHKLILLITLAASASSVFAQSGSLFSDVQVKDTGVAAIANSQAQIGSFHNGRSGLFGKVSIKLETDAVTALATERSLVQLGAVVNNGTHFGKIDQTVYAKEVLLAATDKSTVAIGTVSVGGASATELARASAVYSGNYQSVVEVKNVEITATDRSTIRVGGMDIRGQLQADVTEELLARNVTLAAGDRSEILIGGVSASSSANLAKIEMNTLVSNAAVIAEQRSKVTIGGAHFGK